MMATCYGRDHHHHLEDVSISYSAISSPPQTLEFNFSDANLHGDGDDVFHSRSASLKLGSWVGSGGGIAGVGIVSVTKSRCQRI